MSARQFFAMALAPALLGGCALQAGGGWTTGMPDKLPRILTVEARTFPVRSSGAMLGFATTLAVTDAQRPLLARSGTLLAGYHFRTARRFPRGFGWEPAFEFGFGQPVFRDYSGAGVYTGVNGTATYRLFGDGDDEPRYDTFAAMFDLVAAVRAGIWSGPEGCCLRPTFGEAGMQLGIRLTLSSDVLTQKAPEGKR